MFRRLMSATVLVTCTGLHVSLPQSGRRSSSPTVNERVARSPTTAISTKISSTATLNLAVDGGKDMTFPINRVAVIDFVGGTPPTSELARLGTRNMLVLRDGTTQDGRFVNMTGGDTLFWENSAGQQQRYAIQAIARVH